MKITERILVDLCRKMNADQLKRWDSGLKIERRGDEYFVIRLFRRPQNGRPRCLDLYRGSSREIKAFCDGFAHAAELVNSASAE